MSITMDGNTAAVLVVFCITAISCFIVWGMSR